MNLNVDKRNWKKVKLDDVCEWYQKNIPNDEQFAYGIKYYVTANHIDTDSIKFDRYNELQDGQKGPTITKHFEKGDLLLSTRSVALRKAALAPISGVTGEKLLVLRVKQESALLKEFMPFLFQSVDFWEYAQNSASGSVNKFTSWTKIREYEFLLPPKDQQAKLAELLWAMDEVIEEKKRIVSVNEVFKDTISKELLLGKNVGSSDYQKSPYGQIPSNWELIDLFELRDKNDKYSFTGGPFGSDLKSSHYTDSGVRVLQLQNIGEGVFLDDYSIFTSEEKADQLKSCNIFPGEIILAKMAPVARCCLIPENDPRYLMCSDGIRLKVDGDRYFNKFVYHALNSKHFRRYAETKSTGSTRGRIGLTDLKKIPIPIPPDVNSQVGIAHKIDKVDFVNDLAIESLKSSQALQKSLINQVF